MTIKFSSPDGNSLYAAKSDDDVLMWTPLAVANYGPDPAPTLSTELGVPVSEFEGLDEALTLIADQVAEQVAAARNVDAETARAILALKDARTS